MHFSTEILTTVKHSVNTFGNGASFAATANNHLYTLSLPKWGHVCSLQIHGETVCILQGENVTYHTGTIEAVTLTVHLLLTAALNSALLKCNTETFSM